MSLKDIPEDVRRDIQQAFLDADNKLRALPEEFHNDLADAALIWALNSYLPVSKYYKGIWAYTVHPDDAATHGGPVFIAHTECAEDVARVSEEPSCDD